MGEYKHYMRKNDNNDVIKLFSDAFESPKKGDICICDTDSRHVMLNDEVNPQIEDEGVYLYTHVDKQVIKNPPEELELQKAKIKIENDSKPKIKTLEERVAILESKMR